MRTPKIPSKIPSVPIPSTSSMSTRPPSMPTRRTPIRFSNQTLLFMFLIVIAFLIYLYNIQIAEIRSEYKPSYTTIGGIDPAQFLIPRPSADAMVHSPTIGGFSTKYDVLSDPYVPPVKVDGYVFDSRSSDIRGLPPLVAPVQTTPPPYFQNNLTSASATSAAAMLPVNVETRGIQNQYTQVGILTKSGSGSLFSRKTRNSGEQMDDGVESRLILPLMGRRHMTGRDKWQYYAISNTGNLNTKLPIRSNGRSCTSEYGCDPLTSGDVVYVEGYNHEFKATVYENSIFSYLPVL